MNQEPKKITYLGKEKTEFAIVTTDRLALIVQRWINRRLEHVDDKDESGRPTPKALMCAQQLDDYMDEQFAFFASRGLEKNRAYTEAIIPTGEFFTNPKGERLEKFRIVKRNQSLEPVFEDDKDGEHGASIRASMRMPSERFGLHDETKRGKYNDGGILIMQSAASIDRSETLSMD